MRVILCFLIALAAAPAWAEWVSMSENDDPATYVDPATVRKDGNLRRAWMVQDLKQKGKNGEMSRRTLVEYDCKEERSRPISYSLHTEPKSGGQMLLTNDYYGRWTAIVSGTDGAFALYFVCTR